MCDNFFNGLSHTLGTDGSGGGVLGGVSHMLGTDGSGGGLVGEISKSPVMQAAVIAGLVYMSGGLAYSTTLGEAAGMGAEGAMVTPSALIGADVNALAASGTAAMEYAAGGGAGAVAALTGGTADAGAMAGVMGATAASGAGAGVDMSLLAAGGAGATAAGAAVGGDMSALVAGGAEAGATGAGTAGAGTGLFGLPQGAALPLITGGLGLINGLTGGNNPGPAAPNAADPFASQRPQYQAMLQKLMTDPKASLAASPGYAAGLDAVMRSQSAQGYQGSGNMSTALLKYGGDIYNQQVGQLSTLAGATTGSPGTAGQIVANQQQNSANNNMNSLNLLAYGASMAGWA